MWTLIAAERPRKWLIQQVDGIAQPLDGGPGVDGITTISYEFEPVDGSSCLFTRTLRCAYSAGFAFPTSCWSRAPSPPGSMPITRRSLANSTNSARTEFETPLRLDCPRTLSSGIAPHRPASISPALQSGPDRDRKRRGGSSNSRRAEPPQNLNEARTP